MTPDTDPCGSGTSPYWDDVASEWIRREPGVWRAVSDAVNLDLVERWLPAAPRNALLKTDLFDELAGSGLLGALSASFGSVAGVDVSRVVVERVRERHPGVDARVADVRRLPFADHAFDAVVSNSTLDHFSSLDTIASALTEIHRVLLPGGALVVTLDNGSNPIVAARNALPPRWRARTRLVPYDVGATCRRPAELTALLERGGFEVVELGAVLHSPRVLAVLAGRLVDRHGGQRARSVYLRSLLACERLARLSSRFVTGHFVAALAVKP